MLGDSWTLEDWEARLGLVHNYLVGSIPGGDGSGRKVFDQSSGEYKLVPFSNFFNEELRLNSEEVNVYGEDEVTVVGTRTEYSYSPQLTGQ